MVGNRFEDAPKKSLSPATVTKNTLIEICGVQEHAGTFQRRELLQTAVQRDFSIGRGKLGLFAVAGGGGVQPLPGLGPQLADLQLEHERFKRSLGVFEVLVQTQLKTLKPLGPGLIGGS